MGIASGIVELMQQPSRGTAKEITILSKASSEMPTSDEWKDMFSNPGPAGWPDFLSAFPEGGVRTAFVHTLEVVVRPLVRQVNFKAVDIFLFFLSFFELDGLCPPC